jgi:hypothetical protein
VDWPITAAASFCLAAATATASCRGVPPQPVPVVVLRAPEDPSAAPAPPSATPAVDPPRAASLLPGTFRCGSGACKAGKETCCSDSAEGVCVATVPPGPYDYVQTLASQLEVCGDAHLARSLSTLTRCGDAADCGKDEACCGQWLYSGAVAVVCLPATPSKPSPCEIFERCTSSCRAEGAACVEGACRKPLDAVRCDAATCTGAHPACCGAPPACHAVADCARQPRYRCASPSDCLPGETCASTPTGTSCTRLLDALNMGVVCESDGDCPDSMCIGSRGRPSCKLRPAGWFRSCDCP